MLSSLSSMSARTKSDVSFFARSCQSSANVPYDVPSFEIIPNLAVSPFGVIQNGTNGFDSIETPSHIKTFKIDNFIYAGVFGTNSNSFTIVNITDPSSPSQVSVLDSTVNSMFAITKVAYAVIDGFTYAISTSIIYDRVLIINVSNPSLPSLVTYVTNGVNYTELKDPFDVTTVTIGPSTFALVASYIQDSIQIIDITDPSNPIPASALTDGEDGFTELDGSISVTTVTIGPSTFALVASFWDNGVQIIDITDPYNPIPASAITNGVGGYTELLYPQSVTTVKIGTSTFALAAIGPSTFALVASFWDNGVQIIDITDPYNPIPASAITNGVGGYTELLYPQSVTTVKIGTSTFALAAAIGGDGVQIIDITDPHNPTPASALTSDDDGYEALIYAVDITPVTLGASTYALVATLVDNGVRIIDITDPYNPIPASAITSGVGGYTKLFHPHSFTTVQKIDTSTFAIVSAIVEDGLQIVR